jgi:hypothetical protein
VYLTASADSTQGRDERELGADRERTAETRRSRKRHNFRPPYRPKSFLATIRKFGPVAKNRKNRYILVRRTHAFCLWVLGIGIFLEKSAKYPETAVTDLVYWSKPPRVGCGSDLGERFEFGTAS